MRRTIPYAVAVVATIVAVLGVMVGVGVGQPTTHHGGTPSDVFMTTEPGICGDGVDVNGASLMRTEVVSDETSDLLVYSTSEFSGLDPRTELLLGFLVYDEVGLNASTGFDWGFFGDPRAHSTATVMWTFKDVPAGDYDVYLSAWVDPVPGPLGGGHPHATLENCALTVLVVPPA